MDKASNDYRPKSLTEHEDLVKNHWLLACAAQVFSISSKKIWVKDRDQAITESVLFTERVMMDQQHMYDNQNWHNSLSTCVLWITFCHGTDVFVEAGN